METDWEIHLATDEERRIAHANCHDVWSLGLPLTEHIARREQSALHQRARWIVGLVAGRIVAALAIHPLDGVLHGRSLPGIGIASVHTLREFRGQGLAARLIHWSEDFERQRGAQFSVLFCDIAPRYYEQLGYQLCPAHSGWADVTATATDAAADEWALAESTPAMEVAQELAQCAMIYETDHRQRTFAIDRTTNYWRHLAERFPQASRLWLRQAGKAEPLGYAWVEVANRALVIHDHAVRDGNATSRMGLWNAILAVARQRGLDRAGGWMVADGPLPEAFKLSPRHDEITMVKSLDPGVTFDAEAIAASAWVQEVDHV